MVTRIRIEAEGSTAQEVEEILSTAHEVVSNGSGAQFARMFGSDNEALADAQSGEYVIERFAKEDTGAIVYRGRCTAHYAKPAKVRKLNRRDDSTAPYVEV